MTEHPTTLPGLIDAAAIKHEASINQLAKNAQAAGFTASQTLLNNIYNGVYRSKPKRPTLEAIAYLAGVPIEVVYAAADLDPPGAPFRPAPGADKLTLKQRDVVNAVIREFATLNAQLSNSSDTDGAVDHSDGVAYVTESDLIDPEPLADMEQAD